jgi:hypothetical protein
MNKKPLCIILFSLICIAIAPSIAQATTITSCEFDRKPYYPGQTGYITVTIYNDKDDAIRITELTATIDYYYTDQVVYEQTFFTNATLPLEIQNRTSRTLIIPFSLPTNIAPGYTQLYVRGRAELWNRNSRTWSGSEYPTFQPTLFIESPYKTQLLDLQSANGFTTILMYVFVVAALILGVAFVFHLLISRRPAIINPPVN